MTEKQRDALINQTEIFGEFTSVKILQYSGKSSQSRVTIVRSPAR